MASRWEFRALVWFSQRTTQDEKQARMMGDGFFPKVFTHVGQWGTHVDPSAHFHKGLRTVDQIESRKWILPLVCIDVRARWEHFCSIRREPRPTRDHRHQKEGECMT